MIWSRHPDPDNNDNLRCDHHREQDFAACLDSHALPVTGLDLSRTRLHLLNDICRQMSQVNHFVCLSLAESANLPVYPLRSRQTLQHACHSSWWTRQAIIEQIMTCQRAMPQTLVPSGAQVVGYQEGSPCQRLQGGQTLNLKNENWQPKPDTQADKRQARTAQEPRGGPLSRVLECRIPGTLLARIDHRINHHP